MINMKKLSGTIAFAALVAIAPSVVAFAQAPTEVVAEATLDNPKDTRSACARLETLTYISKERVVSPNAVLASFRLQCAVKGGFLVDDFAVTSLPDGISTSYTVTCQIYCPGNRFILPRQR